MSKMDSVVHFEMPYDDRERMAKFYRDAFGWQTRMLGEEMGNYVIATTTETDESGPKRPGAINGGFFARKPDWPAQHPSLVIAVDNIQAAMKKVAEAGGKVLGEPIEIPGIGQYRVLRSTLLLFLPQERINWMRWALALRKKCLREFQNAKPIIAGTRSRCSVGTYVGSSASPQHAPSFQSLSATPFQHSRSPRERLSLKRSGALIVS